MKQIIVLGLGKSGLAAAELLLKKGKQVLGFDDKKISGPSLEHSVKLGLQVLNDVSFIPWDFIEYIVVSPGIGSEHPVYKKAQERHLEIIGEIGLAFRFLSQHAVAITGTNGKTTVTMLVEHVIKKVGWKARAVGNIGYPLCEYVQSADPEEILVVELSSFQLETFSSKVFDAAVILNITPDHLDRYPHMLAYADAKCSLQRCLKDEGVFFVHRSVCESYSNMLKEPYVIFNEIYLQNLSTDYTGHDRDNILAAWVLCQSLGISAEKFLTGLKTFQKPSHRIEFVCEIDGICYYDDSKGTNIDAVVQAVRAMKKRVILIAGGVDKGSSYAPWIQLKDKIKCLILIGEAAPKIYRDLLSHFEMVYASDLSQAVLYARDKAMPGDSVLLSPGCSSYDMFKNYAHRGQEFQRCVHHLIKGRAS